MIKKVALIAPPANIGLSMWLEEETSFISCLRAAFINGGSESFIGENMGLQFVAKSLERVGVDVVLIDGCLRELTIDQIVEKALEEEVDLIGIFCIEDLLNEVIQIIKQIKLKKFKGRICLGGPMAIIAPKEIRLKITRDVEIFSGDNDAFAAYLISSNYSLRNNNSNEQDWWPCRYDTKVAINKNFALGMLSSRGCSYGKCGFCTLASIANKMNYTWINRPAKDIVDEFIAMTSLYKPQWITFADEDFLGAVERTNERTNEIASNLIKMGNTTKWMIDCRVDQVEYDMFSKLYDSGLSRVFIGIEHSSDKSLNRMKKGITERSIEKAIGVLDKLSIEFTPGYIQFLPWETPKEALESFKFYRSLGHYELGKATTSLRKYAGTSINYDRIDNPWYKYILNQSDKYSKQAMRIYLSWNKVNKIIPETIIQKASTCHHDLIEALILLCTHSAIINMQDIEDIVNNSLYKLSEIDKEFILSTSNGPESNH